MTVGSRRQAFTARRPIDPIGKLPVNMKDTDRTQSGGGLDAELALDEATLHSL